MKESKLSPFDGDLLAMIADITKVEPKVTENDDRFVVDVQPELTIPGETMEALGKAVAGRLGDRLLGTSENHGVYSFYISYDPEEMRTRLVDPDATAGTRYCRTLLEVDAIQFRRDNVDDVLRFTGGGTVTTPRTPDGKAMFSFPDGNGIFVDVPESWYIVRELNGRFTARPEKDFKREFEPKGNIAPVPIITPIPYHVQRLFSDLFGNDIESRCRKLTEEYNEFMEVVPGIYGKNIAQCTDEQLAEIIDELADLNGVIFHIAGILGLSQWELVLLAYDKVKGRQTDPNYKRTHPHEQKHCGNCDSITSEDANGDGYCYTTESPVNCENPGCKQWQKRHSQFMNDKK